MADEPRKHCETCEHFSKPRGEPNCEHVKLVHMTADHGQSRLALEWIRRNDPISAEAEDCPLHALASELVVKQYRAKNGECPYCAWPDGNCHHSGMRRGG